MGLDEARDRRDRAERELEHLVAAVEVHEADAPPDAVLGAYAAMANLTGMIVFSDAVDQGTQALRQATQSLLHDIVPMLGATIREALRRR
jgi:hypothetical protein